MGRTVQHDLRKNIPAEEDTRTLKINIYNNWSKEQEFTRKEFELRYVMLDADELSRAWDYLIYVKEAKSLLLDIDIDREVGLEFEDRAWNKYFKKVDGLTFRELSEVEGIIKKELRHFLNSKEDETREFKYIISAEITLYLWGETDESDSTKFLNIQVATREGEVLEAMTFSDLEKAEEVAKAIEKHLKGAQRLGSRVVTESTWNEELLNLFSDDIKKDIVIPREGTYTMDGRHVYKNFEYKGETFAAKLVYKYAYISIDERPETYLYTVSILDAEDYNYIFSKDVYTYDKLNAQDFEKHLGKDLKESTLRKYTQRELRDLIFEGYATDLDTIPKDEELRKRLRRIGYSTGTYGVSGGLWSDPDTGKWYAVVGRSTNLFYYEHKSKPQSMQDRLNSLTNKLSELYDELGWLESLLSRAEERDLENIRELMEDTLYWINWHQVEIAWVKGKINRGK